jgi:hypothetical protein
MHLKFTLTLFVFCVLAAGCSITREVHPVPYKINALCLERNNDTFMDDYHGTLESTLMTLGIKTRSIWPNEEKECDTLMKYHAEWTWDLAMYLSEASFSVYKGQDLVGYAKYEPGRFSFNPGKFGGTDNKAKDILRELFKNQ